MTTTWSVRRVHALDDAQIDELAGVTIDCVEGDASIGFMHPLTRDRAVAFWRHVAQGVTAGERALLVAEDAHGICGTVQLVLEQPDNQPHRADLSKMQVHRRARRKGLAAALIRAAETTARECGKTLLVLDAVTGGDAARLYERLGWERVGDIPGYALMPRGGLCSTTVYYRNLMGSSFKNTDLNFTPDGWRSVTPRIVVHGAQQLVEFLEQVFGATGDYQPDRPAVMNIGDSKVMISDAGVRNPMPAFLYVYVERADETYRRALQAGAVSVEEPTDTPYGDRRGMVVDPWGNTWQIATWMEHT
jgi:uncharacterized glyoxalase superfamily protein PhnB/GNAT superfamily N-acetyltransferase